MIKSAVTISLVPEARGGPFVFWDDLEAGCRKAAELGFDAIELFPPAPDAVSRSVLGDLLQRYKLRLAAVGTGAGWVRHRLTLNADDPAGRGLAVEFIRQMIDFAGSFGAPAIVGSMQGREVREVAWMRLVISFDELGQHARQYGVPLLYEPLNRYETDVSNTLEQGVQVLKDVPYSNVKILADLFHMNIEEADVPAALRDAADWVGHVHFADSNRRPVGLGHTDMAPVVAALNDIGYDGYVSAECLPYPDSDAAARQTMDSFRKYFR